MHSISWADIIVALTYIPSKMHHIYTPIKSYSKNKCLKKIYDDYFENLKEIKNKYSL
jgi:hypothetical protein